MSRNDQKPRIVFSLNPSCKLVRIQFDLVQLKAAKKSQNWHIKFE